LNVEHICFDLDGTLVQSSKTIYKATLKTLLELNIATGLPEDKFNEMIGLHFIDIFNELKITVPDFEEFIGIYKEVYFDFIEDSNLYPFVEETLSLLKEKNNTKVSLLTTKSQDQADRIVRYFHLHRYFDFVMGRREGIAHKPSAEPLLFVCEQLNVKSKSSMIVGDTELDIQCGKNAGAKTCGVLYGYRTKDQIEKEKPDINILNLVELKNYLG
jgi:phosphoglycolate phosphatase/pyrophosphatase PpaX